MLYKLLFNGLIASFAAPIMYILFVVCDLRVHNRIVHTELMPIIFATSFGFSLLITSGFVVIIYFVLRAFSLKMTRSSVKLFLLPLTLLVVFIFFSYGFAQAVIFFVLSFANTAVFYRLSEKLVKNEFI